MYPLFLIGVFILFVRSYKMNIKKFFKKEKKTYILRKGIQVEKYMRCAMISCFQPDLNKLMTYTLGKDIEVRATTKAKALRKIDRLLNIMYGVEVNYSSEGFYEDLLIYDRNSVQEIN